MGPADAAGAAVGTDAGSTMGDWSLSVCDAVPDGCTCLIALTSSMPTTKCNKGSLAFSPPVMRCSLSGPWSILLTSSKNRRIYPDQYDLVLSGQLWVDKLL